MKSQKDKENERITLVCTAILVIVIGLAAGINFALSSYNAEAASKAYKAGLEMSKRIDNNEYTRQ